MRLKDLGIGRLWNEDPEILWPYGLRFLCALATYAYLAPGSRGYGLDRVPPRADSCSPPTTSRRSTMW